MLLPLLNPAGTPKEHALMVLGSMMRLSGPSDSSALLVGFNRLRPEEQQTATMLLIKQELCLLPDLLIYLADRPDSGRSRAEKIANAVTEGLKLALSGPHTPAAFEHMLSEAVAAK